VEDGELGNTGGTCFKSTVRSCLFQGQSAHQHRGL
jgi:hypothetical protein